MMPITDKPLTFLPDGQQVLIKHFSHRKITSEDLEPTVLLKDEFPEW